MIFIFPEKFFSKYIVEKNNEYTVTNQIKYYFFDLDNDKTIEQIEYYTDESTGHSIYFRNGNKLLNMYNLPKSEIFISKELKFADLDKNNIMEMYYLSAFEGNIYLNFFEFNKNNDAIYNPTKIEIDTFELYNGYTDAINYNIDFYNNNIVFDIQAGFNIQPRNIYNYNFKEKTLLITEKSSIVNLKLNILNYQNENYILGSYTSASGNTISTEDYEKYKKSKDSDSLETLQKKQNKVYQYGDFASYILLYNSNLKFAFEPIEFEGWTNGTYSEFIKIDEKPHIVSLTNNSTDTSFTTFLTICNFNGQIINKIELTKDFYGLFCDYESENIVIINYLNKELLVYSTDLKLVNKISDISYILGYKDIDNDSKNELITIGNNELVIYRNNLKENSKCLISNINDNFYIIDEIGTYSENNTDYFYFQSFNERFAFSYYKNKFYLLKYPVFLLIFVFWFGIFRLLLKLNSKRLEAENLKLEKIIELRTSELRDKNEILHSQKEEIFTQAEELKIQNENLNELSNFKKTMTDTIIHDLKNPLSVIMTKSDDKFILQSCKRMLNLVLNVLDIDKYETTEFRLNKEFHSLKAIIETAISNFQVLADEKNITFENNSSDFEVLVDIEVITRVFENILSNAIRFSDMNQKIIFSTKEIKENKISVTIKNFGKQIPENQLSTIFEKYQQILKKDNVNYKSTGLGLTFCKMALEAHKQIIYAQNIENDGVEMVFTLEGRSIDPENVRKLERNNSQNIEFSESEISILKPYIEKLKNIEIYKITEIISVLNQIPDNSNSISEWKMKLQSSIFSANNELYLSLLNIF